MIEIRGITWNHQRGRDPLLATAAAFQRENPDVRISWDARSLHDFGHFPVDKLAHDYDLVVLDHPWVGFICDTACYLPFDDVLPVDVINELSRHSAGPSHASYRWEARQWALAIDAATPCASYRPDLLKGLHVEVPRSWEEVIELGRICSQHGLSIGLPLGPVDAMTAFLSLAANLGVVPFSNQEQVVEYEVGRTVLDNLARVLPYCCNDVFSLTPIAVMDRMSTTNLLAYCPLAYSYNNYSRPGFRSHLCEYADMPSIGTHGPCGSHLGGTGISVSRRCQHVDVAANYAAQTASAEWQRTIYFDAGGQPAHKAAWTDDAVNAKCNNFFLNTRQTIEQAYVRPRYNGYIRFQYEGGEILARFLASCSGNASEVLDNLNELYISTLPV